MARLRTAREIGIRLGFSPLTILKWARQGRIPKRTLGYNVVRFVEADVVAALEAHEAERAAAR